MRLISLLTIVLLAGCFGPPCGSKEVVTWTDVGLWHQIDAEPTTPPGFSMADAEDRYNGTAVATRISITWDDPGLYAIKGHGAHDGSSGGSIGIGFRDGPGNATMLRATFVALLQNLTALALDDIQAEADAILANATVVNGHTGDGREVEGRYYTWSSMAWRLGRAIEAGVPGMQIDATIARAAKVVEMSQGTLSVDEQGVAVYDGDWRAGDALANLEADLQVNGFTTDLGGHTVTEEFCRV